MAESERYKKAVRWAAQRRSEEPALKTFQIVEDASLRFDLSPAEAEALRALLAGTSS